jgi:hypothetical protein
MSTNGTMKAAISRGHERMPGDVEEAYDLFGNQGDGVVKVALTP